MFKPKARARNTKPRISREKVCRNLGTKNSIHRNTTFTEILVARLFNEVYFEYHAYATRISVNVLLKKLSKDYKCEIVGNVEFYERHG
jgi:hypothetical protein